MIEAAILAGVFIGIFCYHLRQAGRSSDARGLIGACTLMKWFSAVAAMLVVPLAIVSGWLTDEDGSTSLSELAMLAVAPIAVFALYMFSRMLLTVQLHFFLYGLYQRKAKLDDATTSRAILADVRRFRWLHGALCRLRRVPLGDIVHSVCPGGQTEPDTS